MAETITRGAALKTLDEREAALKENPDQQVRKQFSIVTGEKAINDEQRTARFVITTQGVDRDNDTVSATGWDVNNFLKSPVVLWAHDYSQMPVARASELVSTPKGLEATAQFPAKGIYAFADLVFEMLKGGFLSATSVGFRPSKWMRNEERGGIDFVEQELLEFSVVPVPANPEALIVARSKGLDTDLIKMWAEGALVALHGKSGVWVPKADVAKCACGADAQDGKSVCAACETKAEPASGMGDAPKCESRGGDMTDGMCPTCQAMGAAVNEFVAKHVATDDDPIRWNKALSKAFDVAAEPLEASRTELAWVARYLEAKIQDISESGFFVPSARMGSFLAALDEKLLGWQVDALRNLTESGKEVPPSSETIRLSSVTSRSFLVEGTRFMRRVDDVKMTVKLSPVWSGLYVSSYIEADRASVAGEFFDGVWQRASELNYLRGEAFTLSGEFLDRGNLDFSDLFLDASKEAVIRRTVDVINEEGEHMASRGVLLMGPPGTGKTLSGKVVMRQADSTFVWCSARDLYRSGAFGGLAYAFEIASECAPTVLFIEDVDNFLDGYTIDLLKTEMDGLKRRKGIVTILTSNFPELLPDTLIDRPGRFHDLVEMALPNEPVRRRMLDAWLPEAPDEARAATAKETDGFSGAHLYELGHFARTLEKESKGAMTLGAAMTAALAKIREQRELVSSLRSQDYRPRLQVRAMVGVSKALVEKRGRVLSAANERRLRTAQDSITAATDELAGVLVQLQTAPEAPEPGDDVVLSIDDDVTVDDVMAEIKSALRESLPGLGGIVKEETRAALARARGRVD